MINPCVIRVCSTSVISFSSTSNRRIIIILKLFLVCSAVVFSHYTKNERRLLFQNEFQAAVVATHSLFFSQRIEIFKTVIAASFYVILIDKRPRK